MESMASEKRWNNNPLGIEHQSCDDCCGTVVCLRLTFVKTALARLAAIME